MRLCSLAMVFGLAAPSLAASAPLITVEANAWDSGKLSIEVHLKHPAKPAERFAPQILLGGPAKGWSEGISVTVTSSAGVVQKWPLKREDKGFGKTMWLTTNSGAALSFTLDKKAFKALPNGAYEVSATLDLSGSGQGFQGVLTAPAIELDIGVAPPPVLPGDLAALVTALDSEKSMLRRRELALGLEALLLDAPLLPPGKSLDTLATAHLKELTRRMCTAADVYRAEPASGRPLNSVLFTYRVLISPGQLSRGFEGALRGLPLGPSTPAGFVGSPVDVSVGVAADRAEFRKWIHEKKAPGLLLLPVHLRDGIARVVTSVVPAGGPPQHFFEISYWKQEKDGWRLVSFEPNSASRDWTSNVHHLGPGPKNATDLSPTERAQWLDAVLESVELVGHEASLDHQFGPWVFDASYVPLLQARLERGSPTTQSAAALQLGRLKVEVPTAKLLALMKSATVDQQKLDLTDTVWNRLEPLLKSARLATAEEARSIISPSNKATGNVRVTDDFALHEVDDLSSGSQTLYAKTPTGWVLVGTMRHWIY